MPGLGEGGRAGAGSRRRDRRDPRLQPARAPPVPDRRHAEGEAYQAAVDYELGVIAGKVDRPYKPARLVRHGLRSTSSPARPVSCSTGRRRRRSSSPRSRASTRGPGRAPDRRRAAVDHRARPQRRARCRRTSALRSRHARRREAHLPARRRRSSRGCSSSRRRRAAARFSAARLPTPTSPSSTAPSAARPAARTSRRTAAGSSSSRAVTGLGLDVPRSAAAVLAAAESAKNRVAHLTIAGHGRPHDG